jgi:hypothetical protein
VAADYDGVLGDLVSDETRLERMIDRLARTIAICDKAPENEPEVEETRVQYAAMLSLYERDALIQTAANALETVNRLEDLLRVLAQGTEDLMRWMSVKDDLHEGEVTLMRKILDYAPVAARSAVAKKAVRAKLEKDKTQKAKVAAYKLWLDWQKGTTRYKSGAAFCRHAVNVLPEITSVKTVERWCVKWRRQRESEGT